jgi:hypothetical protein
MSGLKYKKCCLGKEDKPEEYTDLPLQSRMHRMMNEGKIKQCIHPNHDECSEKIVKAHSIQNNKILKSIAVNGNVVMIIPECTEKSFDLAAKPKGRNVASTIWGFCGYHDKTVFQPIEDKDYVGSPQQNFLFAYRAFAFEYHKKHEAYKAIRARLKTKPSFVKDDSYINVLKGHEAALNDLAYLKNKFDKALPQDNYSIIDTVCLKFEGTSNVAVCSGFNLEFDISANQLNDVRSLGPERLKFLTFNLFPQNSETIVQFSWLHEDEGFYEGFKCQLLSLSSKEQVKFLNNLIPSYCENTTLNPDYYSGLSYSEKCALLDVFRATFSL